MFRANYDWETYKELVAEYKDQLRTGYINFDTFTRYMLRLGFNAREIEREAEQAKGG
jgi:hypothetical protein